ncbi:DUF4326 domain-containing protein [Halosimplex pelagicum]|uniref:DUF4326 domain-containing protein n=1 Tax=Halosimplex pelagicum TaxID=869886 RepID=A0A7D5P9S0_9EURY|nr:DUF4326 domain-containing protein [Halosimplex pelagicum]QLH82344.1 DUF4326 domain-containing protein [Halosimplex pelagicum]
MPNKNDTTESTETEETTQQTLSGEPTTEVVNQKHTDDFDIDIGRADRGQSNMNNTPIGESGWLGNPYPKSDHGREKCIELFREDFVERLQNDPEFRSAVKDLQGKTLGCYCKPKACHGDVIVRFIEDGEAFIQQYEG